jgi:hypothetical protein
LFRLSHLERQLFTSRVHLQRFALLDVSLAGTPRLTDPHDAEYVIHLNALETWISLFYLFDEELIVG